MSATSGTCPDFLRQRVHLVEEGGRVEGVAMAMQKAAVKKKKKKLGEKSNLLLISRCEFWTIPLTN